MPEYQKSQIPSVNDAGPVSTDSPKGSSAYRTVVDGGYQLVLVKHDQRYVFRYEPGDESNVLSGLIQMVNDPDTDIDWFDAAIVSHQLGLRMGQTLNQITGGKKPTTPPTTPTNL